MKIGQLVQFYIPKINAFCEQESHSEFEKLMDIDYCKKTFKINYPFYKNVDDIKNAHDIPQQNQSRRYWSPLHIVRGQTVRVTNDWYQKHYPTFIQYLLLKKIAKKEDFNEYRLQELSNEPKRTVVKKALSINARYKGNAISNNSNLNQQSKRYSATKTLSTDAKRYKESAIGSASNVLVRNILSRLGSERLKKQDWADTIKHFKSCCVYCGNKSAKLTIDHAVPINKKSLGEHRLGNLVPSCRECNASKADQHFEYFLKDDDDKIQIIKAYMDSKNYVPLGDNGQVRVILEMAYDEVSKVAERYITILNQLFSK